eukprot:5449930-Prymnesium_polylepis.1
MCSAAANRLLLLLIGPRLRATHTLDWARVSLLHTADRTMTSLLKLQAVSRCQAQLIELYEAKVAILGTITSDTAEILIARPGASVFKAVDPTSLDFVNTTGRRKDENKANYVQGLKLAKEATASDWEQVGAATSPPRTLSSRHCTGREAARASRSSRSSRAARRPSPRRARALRRTRPRRTRADAPPASLHPPVSLHQPAPRRSRRADDNGQPRHGDAQLRALDDAKRGRGQSDGEPDRPAQGDRHAHRRDAPGARDAAGLDRLDGHLSRHAPPRLHGLAHPLSRDGRHGGGAARALAGRRRGRR